MLRHVAVFAWKPEATASQKDAFTAGLTALPAQISEIRSYVFGPDAGIVPGNADFAVVADFDDADAYLRYTAHPAHQALLADLLRPILSTRNAIQLEIGAETRNPDMSSDR